MSLYDKKLNKKLEALNAIRQLYSTPRTYFCWDEFDSSPSEQRQDDIKRIIEKLEKDLYEIQMKINYRKVKNVK